MGDNAPGPSLSVWNKEAELKKVTGPSTDRGAQMVRKELGWALCSSITPVLSTDTPGKEEARLGEAGSPQESLGREKICWDGRSHPYLAWLRWADNRPGRKRLWGPWWSQLELRCWCSCGPAGQRWHQQGVIREVGGIPGNRRGGKG